jgi:hypothetical protein
MTAAAGKSSKGRTVVSDEIQPGGVTGDGKGPTSTPDGKGPTPPTPETISAEPTSGSSGKGPTSSPGAAGAS